MHEFKRKTRGSGLLHNVEFLLLVLIHGDRHQLLPVIHVLEFIELFFETNGRRLDSLSDHMFLHSIDDDVVDLLLGGVDANFFLLFYKWVKFIFDWVLVSAILKFFDQVRPFFPILLNHLEHEQKFLRPPVSFDFVWV